jgi:hypothetical protein
MESMPSRFNGAPKWFSLAFVIVVLVIADSLRADSLGYAGGAAHTPTLDRLASEGSQFRHAISSAAWTVPSLVSMATGTFPHRIGVSRWRHPFPARRPTLMSAFAAAGFDVHSVVHNPRYCFANMGFRGTVSDSEDPDQVIRALSAPRGSDRLVIIHHWWTHLPYRNEPIPRKNWRALCSEIIDKLAQDPESEVPLQRQRYADAISWFDQQLLSRYLDAASSGGDDVVLAVTGDHGENWGDSLPPGRKMAHMYDLHGRWMTDETTRVPMLFWGKGTEGAVPAGRTLGGFARGVDMAPTLAALAGVPWPGPLPSEPGPTLVDRGIREVSDLELDGISLASPLHRSVSSPVRDALTVTSYNAIVPAKYPTSGKRMWRRFSLRTQDRRYTWDGQDRYRAAIDIDDDFEGVTAAGLARLSDGLKPLMATWGRFARERKSGLGPAPKLDPKLFPPFGAAAVRGIKWEDDDGGLGGDGEKLAKSMSMTGYMD